MSEVVFKIGDAVTVSPMWKYECAVGKVIKITKDYVVVRWNDVNGDWHYTVKQAQKLQHI
jgi:hypothetical protein